MPTVTVHAPELAGSTGLELWIYSASAAAILNAGGDTLTELANGLFSATVDETWADLQRADIKDANGLVLRSGWLAVGSTEVLSRPLSLKGSLNETQALDLLLAAAAGETSQTDDTETFKFLDGTDAFVTTFDESGNRADVALQ